MSSVSRRGASLDVQRPLRNEQGDNFDLEQSKKNTISTFFLFLHAQKWVAGVDECRSGCLSPRVHKNKSRQLHTMGSATAEFEVRHR